jgi:hypothetical protein
MENRKYKVFKIDPFYGFARKEILLETGDKKEAIKYAEDNFGGFNSTQTCFITNESGQFITEYNQHAENI